jgi:hypothetical protein
MAGLEPQSGITRLLVQLPPRVTTHGASAAVRPWKLGCHHRERRGLDRVDLKGDAIRIPFKNAFPFGLLWGRLRNKGGAPKFLQRFK